VKLYRRWAGGDRLRQKAMTLAKAQSSQRKVKILREFFLETRAVSHAFDFDFPWRGWRGSAEFTECAAVSVVGAVA
jgi:hypothetical protein